MSDMTNEEKVFRKELYFRLVDMSIVSSLIADFNDNTDDAVFELCSDSYPSSVQREILDFLADPKFADNNYVQDLRNKVLARHL